MRGSHGLPPSLLGPIGKTSRRQTVLHMSTQDAGSTRVRKVLRLVAPLFRVPSVTCRVPEACYAEVPRRATRAFYLLRSK